jgi:hypothetical protein
VSRDGERFDISDFVRFPALLRLTLLFSVAQKHNAAALIDTS